MLLGIANGQYDVAGDGITYTLERDQTVDFSQLYQAYDETLLIRDNDTRFTTADELKKLDKFMVATQIGTTNEITAKNLFGEANVKSFDTFGAAIEALKNDDADAVVVDRPAAEGYIEAQGGLKTLPESLAGIEGLAFAFLLVANLFIQSMLLCPRCKPVVRGTKFMPSGLRPRSSSID